MTQIERDIRGYFGMDDSDALYHYGTKRHSGRYPWGSGETPYQHSGDFLSRVDQLKSAGMSEKERYEAINATLPDEYKMGASEFRYAQTVAKHQRWQLQYDKIRAMKDDGLGATEIGRKLGLSESTVRSMLSDGVAARKDRASNTMDILRKAVEEKGIVDVGKGVEKELGVTEDVLNEAIYRLEAEENLHRFGVGVKDPTNNKQQTTTTVLTAPEYDQKYVYAHQEEIQSIKEYHSDDSGLSFRKLQTPTSLDSSRVTICYEEDGGKAKDGVIEIRPGVADLTLGDSMYAQVRILVDGTHYLKGMAIYSDDLPEGKDIRFNTNKSKDVPMCGPKDNTVLKCVKGDSENPFGASLYAEGQTEYTDADGNTQISPINKIKWEGQWDTMAKNISSQFLSKQPRKLIKQQLDLTIADYEAQFDEIMNYNNPTVKRKMLQDFANSCDGNACTLKASFFPGQSTKVILPVTNLKENECYAPAYADGTQVALIRYPHAGTFEIPICTVNNRNKSGKTTLGNVMDAIGINSATAERLSGADFDGDTVTVIPLSDKVNVKSTKPYKELETFDAKKEYAIPEGNPNNVQLMTKANTQREMGIISNLITDMTLRGAPREEMIRAVKHSMVVIDAEKHMLDYKRSERENGIQELKEKWQLHIKDDGSEGLGASTLLSRRKQDVRIDERQGSGRIDKETGELIYKTSGRTYVDKKGKVQEAKEVVSRISLAKDAHELSSGTWQEELYADFSNKLKALANEARKQSLPENAGRLEYSKAAEETYADEVRSLNEKLLKVELNAPRERQAKVIANANIKAKIQALGLDSNKTSDKKEIRKISAVELQRARDAVNASGKKNKIKITDREWEAIQAGAIHDTKLMTLLNHADKGEVSNRARPKQTTILRKAQINKAKAMLANGYTYAEIADTLGVPKSTIYDGVNK